MQSRGRAGAMALALLGAGLMLSACVTDQQAVDLGLATACKGTTTYSPLGDANGRYWKGIRREVCNGPKKDAGNRDQVVLIDCSADRQMLVTARQAMADQRRHGPDFDRATDVSAQMIRLKLGLTDLAGAAEALRAAGVPLSQDVGGAEQCKAPAPAAPLN